MKWKMELTEQMENKRRLMVFAANEYGLTSVEAVKHSQELDQLMNLYRMICQKGIAGPFFPIYRESASLR
ncbi:aspartyl-phosphate phosphatase Spo0E family protein [Alkalicoccus daliensis]|uniref:Spo0E like sporulation regulatory protein n=1 Tax=Alkalicoccus daliensis TaxID=745820 RepID=A0A1H0I8H9_9BACI|nr:aspartyl-phosphate phosphatase Spo0E family protein [Alkalicoccus daliensis]SDO27686.1 Spo0E like sporulation regulatory protein [Alkalicoccus daliensis]